MAEQAKVIPPSGDASMIVKSSLSAGHQYLLQHIISSWQSGYTLDSHDVGMNYHQQITTLIQQANSLAPNTCKPDAIGPTQTGAMVHQQLLPIIQATYLKMPNTLTTNEVKQQLELLSAVEASNQSFSAAISTIIFAKGAKANLTIGYANLTILINATRQLLQDWLNGSTVDNLNVVNDMLSTIQL